MAVKHLINFSVISQYFLFQKNLLIIVSIYLLYA